MQRLHYRRRHSYNTRSNKRRIVKTPGGRVVYQYRKKVGAIPHCGDCKRILRGITPARPRNRAHFTRRLKTVTRAYGGSRCHDCVQNRIVRAFLIEEQKIVARVLKVQATQQRVVEKQEREKTKKPAAPKAEKSKKAEKAPK